jgi:malate synthase
MEYISKLIKGKNEKIESKKVAEFTAEIERNIAERNEQRNRRLSEINREIRNFN